MKVRSALLLGMLALPFGLASADLAREDVPAPLRPWVDWVLYEHEALRCPFLSSDATERRCAWPTRLVVELDDAGGSFAADWQVYAQSWLILPGARELWPQQVRVNGEPAIVLEREGRPQVRAGAGAYRLEGRFRWRELPESFPLPAATGLIELRVNGEPVALPRIDERGRLWLSRPDTVRVGEADRLSLSVYRHIDDDIPLRVTTRLQLEVSGEPREILLGPVSMGEGFIPLAIASPLPARLEPDGRLRVQGRPGTWSLDLVTRAADSVTRLARIAPDAPWSEEEIWVFRAHTDLRLVELHDLTPVDPRQTTLPELWQTLPAYRYAEGDVLRIEVIRRGDPQPEPNQLSLSRSLWLDFDGGGYSARDRITGSMTSGWRIRAGEGLRLGQAVLDGEPQFVTEREGRAGVEVRRGRLELIADGRVEGPIDRLSALGWDHDFHSLAVVLNLPPGWTLLSAGGADSVSDTWFKRWTLLDLFLVLIIAIAVARLWGWRWGLLALLSLTLSWQEPGAPRQVWLHLLAALALLRVLPPGWMRRLVGWYRNATLAVLAVTLVPFLVNEVRNGVYPQLERPRQVQPVTVRVPAPAAPTGGVGGAVIELAPMAQGLVAEAEVQAAPSAAPARSRAPLQMVDPQANIQTGPGIPDWEWTAIELGWSGPVGREQRLDLHLIPPRLNLALAAARVVLLIALAGFFVSLLRARVTARVIDRGAAPMLLAVWGLPALLGSTDAHAEAFPDPALLKTLEERLLEAPECLPRCAEMPRLRVTANERGIVLELEILAAEAVAVALPVDPAQWMPEAILVDGAPAAAIERGSGSLWTRLEPGAHSVWMSGPVPEPSRVRLPLRLAPGRVELHLRGWRAEGVRTDGTADAQLVLIRAAESDAAVLRTMTPNELPAFLQVERLLRLGLDWRVDTRVRRVSDPGAAVVVSVPLLEGEAVTTAALQVEDGAVKVNLAPGERELGWSSVLEKRERLSLVAPDTPDWSESWRLDAGPLWRVESGGLAPIHHQDRNGNWLPEWRPWPGERLDLAVSRPPGVGGRTLTIDEVRLKVEPGERASDVHLALAVRSSQGAQHAITLPEDAELLSVAIDAVAQPIRQQARTVTLPVHPGSQWFELRWRSDAGIRGRFVTPAVELGAESVNTRLSLTLGRDRWTLLTGGPALGPAVLFWGLLIVVLALALGLARSPLTPLGAPSWLLLAIGLSPVNIWLAVVVVAWLLALGWRERRGAGLGKVAFNLSQIGLALLTVAALAILFEAVKQGLLGEPQMQVAGNGSNAYQLEWYQDRSPPALPQAWVLSAPILAYRFAMLAWALWLAFALLRWLRWGWRAYTAGGLWRPLGRFWKGKEPEQSAARES